ncbi:MAG: tyrosine-type recombinase/integrase [[Clostridium] innocuum]
MARKYYSKGMGRVDVYPFKIKDFNEMCRLCLVKRDKAKEESEEKRIWWRNYIMLILGANTGFRIEVMLQIQPFEIAGGKVRVMEQKTQKWQQFEINQKVYETIMKYVNFYEIGPREYLFKSRKGPHPITRQEAYRIIKQLAKEAGVKYAVGCHSLRKSFGRYEYDKTKSIHLVQRMLQHSSPIITQQYICLEDEVISKERKESAWGILD